MYYNLDTDKLSVRSYKELLKAQSLLPGRRILIQNIDKYFAQFENRGIHTVSQLRKGLSSSPKITAFSAESGIPEEYLVILKRETGSLEQKPVPLASFPGIDPSLVERLKGTGIMTSKDYFEKGPAEPDELYSLCDLVRINGVGPAAARAFYDAGYASVSAVASADAAGMLERVSAVNREKQYYKANLGVKDMQFCIDFARLIEKLCV